MRILFTGSSFVFCVLSELIVILASFNSVVDVLASIELLILPHSGDFVKCSMGPISHLWNIL